MILQSQEFYNHFLNGKSVIFLHQVTNYHKSGQRIRFIHVKVLQPTRPLLCAKTDEEEFQIKDVQFVGRDKQFDL